MSTEKFVLWNLRGAYKLCSFATIFLRGENLLAQRYAIMQGYPHAQGNIPWRNTHQHLIPLLRQDSKLSPDYSPVYGLTNTPRISFDSLKGTGNAVSGVTFDYVFMSTHLNVENLNEIVGEFMQRRVNFLVSALGTINTSLEAASETIDVDVQMQPYRLENIADKIDTAIKAKNGEIWSQEHAITFVGNVDSVMDEIEQIKEEQAEKQQEEISKQEQLSKFSSTNKGE